MELEKALDKDLVCVLKGKTKEEVIRELLGLVEKSGRVADVPQMSRQIFRREELMSTGIGLGIAVPHTRMEGVQSPLAAVGVSREGVPDYESIDGELVRIVVLVVAGRFQHREYIKLLSELVGALKDAPARERVVSAKTPEEIFSALRP